MSLASIIAEHASQLTPAERRVAAVIADDPTAAAFATVADLGAAAGTSGPTVVRFATKLGFAGYPELQAEARRGLTDELAAGHRLRSGSATAPVDATRANAARALALVAAGPFETLVGAIAGHTGAIWVLAGEASVAVGTVAHRGLAALRPGVRLVATSPATRTLELADATPDDLVIAVDFPRYEQGLVAAVDDLRDRGVPLVAITDSALSPLAVGAAHLVAVRDEPVGPFDSVVGAIVVVENLLAGVAAERRTPAARRLAVVEAGWARAGVLVDDPTP